MREAAHLLRFFLAAPPVSPMMTGTFAMITLTGAAVVYMDPSRAAGALAPVLVLQVFAASSGFAVPARRGHFDLLLTRGVSRLLLAMAHWVASIAAGVISWLVLAIVERATTFGAPGAMFASGTLAALVLVSTLPWALTIALPRFSGGIGWLLLLVTSGSTLQAPVFGLWTMTTSSLGELYWSAWVALVYPLGLVGRRMSGEDLVVVAPAVAVSVLAMVSACRWIERTDVPLEAAQ